MEELFTTLKNILKNSIVIKADQPNLIISIIIKSEFKGNIAEPEEVENVWWIKRRSSFGYRN
jgi:hypothetical protein